MKAVLRILMYLAALLSCLPFVRPQNQTITVLLWLPKVIAGASSLLLGIVGGLGAVLGLVSRDWKLAVAGGVSAGLAAKYIRAIPDAQAQFEAAFGADRVRRAPVPARRGSLPAKRPEGANWQRDLVYGQSPQTGKALLADLWQPPPGTQRSGLGLIYVHGGVWMIGDKDTATRPFFRRLAGQGHVVLDIAYTLWPEGDIPTMVAEVKQAVLWLKEKGAALGVASEGIVLMGGSAGGHLALLAAYTPDHPSLSPASGDGDTSVRGVIAFYPPVDFLSLHAQNAEFGHQSPALLAKAADALQNWLLQASGGGRAQQEKDVAGVDPGEMLSSILGGDVDERPETYRLLSPISHVGAHCPPTLLLQGSDDAFGLTPAVRRLHRDLKRMGVPSILVEFPHTDHGFDLFLPQVAPAAQAATCDVERFLECLI